MTGVKEIPTDELRAELARRDRAEAALIAASPVPLIHQDFTKLRETVEEGVRQMVQDGYEDRSLRDHVYIAAMTAIYGDVYWVWRRKQKY